MADEQKIINWASVLTTAVSTLVATIVVGAAVLVWNKTANIDKNIANATEDIITTQGELEAQLTMMTKEMGSLNAKIKKIENQLDGHEEYLREKSTATSPSKDGEPVFSRSKLTEQDLYVFREEEVKRMLAEYQKQIQIQQRQQQPRGMRR